MRKLGVIVLALGVLPVVAQAGPLGAPARSEAQVGPLQSITGQLITGRVQEVESQFMQGIASQIEEMDRLRSDARRRNDSIAAGCVEQKLTPAISLRSAANKAAARLRALPGNDIDALNGEVRNLSTAADRIGELTSQARSCLQINSGQVLTSLQLTPETDFDSANKDEKDHLADVIVPRRDNITAFD